MSAASLNVPVSMTHETDNWCQAESGCGGQIDNIHIHTIVNLLICANHWFYKQQNDTEWAWALYGLFIWNMLLIFLLHLVFLLSIVSGPECPISRADRWWEPMWGLRQKTRELAYYMTLDTNYLCRKSWENAIVQWWMYYNNTITMSRLLQYLGCPTQFVTPRLITNYVHVTTNKGHLFALFFLSRTRSTWMKSTKRCCYNIRHNFKKGPIRICFLFFHLPSLEGAVHITVITDTGY